MSQELLPHAIAGRVLASEDDGAPNANPAIVLSYDFWRTKLGAASDVIGRKLLVNSHPMTVIGIAAETFHGIDVGEVPSIWLPASMSSEAIPGFNDYLNRRTRWMQVLGRLNTGMSLQRAQVGLQPWFKAVISMVVPFLRSTGTSDDLRRLGIHPSALQKCAGQVCRSTLPPGVLSWTE